MAGAQPATVPWAVTVVPGLPAASSFLTSPVALVTTPRGDGEAAVGRPDESVVVVTVVDEVVDELLSAAPGDRDDLDAPHPARPSATTASAARTMDRVPLDIGENISQAVSSQTEVHAKPGSPRPAGGCPR